MANRYSKIIPEIEKAFAKLPQSLQDAYRKDTGLKPLQSSKGSEE